MAATTGVTPILTYATGTAASVQLARLIALIPDQDTSPAQGGGAGTHGSHLDEMSPQAAAQLRVELAALNAVIGAYEAL